MSPERAQRAISRAVPESLPRQAAPKRLQSGLAAAAREKLVVLAGCLASDSEGLAACLEPRIRGTSWL